MRRAEWALSALFVAVMALAVTEASLRLDAWPASRVAMFSRHVAPTTTVRRVTLVGTNLRGDRVEVRPGDVGLDPTQYARRFPLQPVLLARSCSQVGRLYNQRTRMPALRLTALRAEVTIVPRPGVPPPARPSWSVECPLAGD